MTVCRWVTGMLLPAGPRSKVERDDENPWNWLLDFDIQIHHAALKVQQIVSTELLFWWFGGSGLEPGVSQAGPLKGERGQVRHLQDLGKGGFYMGLSRHGPRLRTQRR